MNSVWIIGGGKFGLHALHGLSMNPAIGRILLVDQVEPDLTSSIKPGQKIDFIQMDGVRFLKDNLNQDNCPDWIVPAVPLHLAARWCQAILGREALFQIELPRNLDSSLPNPMRGVNGDIYVSHADFFCPINCNEPDLLCTVTRKARKKDMHAVLAELTVPGFDSIVIQSRQLGPGIGGYSPVTLFQLLEKVKSVKGGVMVGTACRCHGVLTGFERSSHL